MARAGTNTPSKGCVHACLVVDGQEEFIERCDGRAQRHRHGCIERAHSETQAALQQPLGSRPRRRAGGNGWDSGNNKYLQRGRYSMHKIGVEIGVCDVLA